MDTSFLSVVSACGDAALAIACLWLANSIGRTSARLAGATAERRRLASILGLALLAIGCFGIGDLVEDVDPAGLLPLILKLIGAAGAVIGAVSVWRWLRRPGMISGPSDAVAAGSAAAEALEAERSLDLFGRLNNDLDDAQRRFSLALEDAQIALVQQDTDLQTVWTYTPPGNPVAELLTATEADAVPAEEPAFAYDAVGRTVATARRQVLATGLATRFEDKIQTGAKTYWYEGRVEPLTRDGELVGLMSVAFDVSRHKENELHLHNVMRELTHRSKNLLAIVQGIARQTSRVATSLPEFVDRFSARLQALSRSQDLLISRSWRGADLRDLVIREFGEEWKEPNGRISVEGEPIALGADATQNIALAIHELAANAQMHGALSVVNGRLDIGWRRRTVDGEPSLELRWRESGGPPVAEPLRRGFGRIMVQQLLPRALGGTSELVFDPSGVVWTLRFPVSRLADDSQ